MIIIIAIIVIVYAFSKLAISTSHQTGGQNPFHHDFNQQQFEFMNQQQMDSFNQQQFQFMDQMNQQQFDEFMQWSMDECTKAGTPFEHGGYDMENGNSFNDFGCGGMF